MQNITINRQATVHHLHPNYDCYTYLNSLKIPDMIFNSLELISPNFATTLEKITRQKYFDPNFPYFDIYIHFNAIVKKNSRTLFDSQRQELLKELASIDGRKQFVAQNGKNKAYEMFLSDALKHSSLEYQEKIQKQLQELDDFIRATAIKLASS